MRVLNIEKMFESEDTLDQVLAECQSDIEQIDYWSGVRKDNLTDNGNEITKALNELSGCFSNLRIVLGIAETEKKNREIRRYGQLRIEAETAKKKFVSAVAEKEASVSVSAYRRIRNLILAYVTAADKHIGTLQSILKDLNKEFTHQSE